MDEEEIIESFRDFEKKSYKRFKSFYENIKSDREFISRKSMVR